MSTAATEQTSSEHDRLLDYAYGELSGDALDAFKVHLLACDKCKAELAGLERVRSAVKRAMPVVEPPVERMAVLHTQLMHAAAQNKPKRGKVLQFARRVATHPGYLAAAMFALVGGAVGLQWSMGRLAMPAADKAAEAPVALPAAPPVVAAPVAPPTPGTVPAPAVAAPAAATTTATPAAPLVWEPPKGGLAKGDVSKDVKVISAGEGGYNDKNTQLFLDTKPGEAKLAVKSPAHASVSEKKRSSGREDDAASLLNPSFGSEDGSGGSGLGTRDGRSRGVGGGAAAGQGLSVDKAESERPQRAAPAKEAPLEVAKPEPAPAAKHHAAPRPTAPKPDTLRAVTPKTAPPPVNGPAQEPSARSEAAPAPPPAAQPPAPPQPAAPADSNNRYKTPGNAYNTQNSQQAGVAASQNAATGNAQNNAGGKLGANVAPATEMRRKAEELANSGRCDEAVKLFQEMEKQKVSLTPAERLPYLHCLRDTGRYQAAQDEIDQLRASPRELNQMVDGEEKQLQAARQRASKAKAKKAKAVESDSVLSPDLSAPAAAPASKK